MPTDNNMQDYFEKNRYNFSQLIDKIKAMKEVPNIIIDEETDIEIYEGNKSGFCLI